MNPETKIDHLHGNAFYDNLNIIRKIVTEIHSQEGTHLSGTKNKLIHG